MTRRITLVFIAASAVFATACGGTATPPLPSPPVAPAGAESIATFAGAAPGRVSADLTLDGQNLVVHAICDGAGTLFVVPWSGEAPPARSGGAAIFECATPATDGRVELLGLPIGDVKFTAYVAELAGASRPAVFSVSIERATD